MVVTEVEVSMFLVTVSRLSVTVCSLCLVAGQCCPNRSLPSDLLQCWSSAQSVDAELWTRQDHAVTLTPCDMRPPSASEQARCEPGDTIPAGRCGCVPQLGVLYEEEDPGPRGGGWAKKIPLLGPFWCVRNTHSTTVRRR